MSRQVSLIPYPLLRGIATARKVLSQCLKVQPARLSVRPLRAVPYQADARLRRRAESRAVDGCERLRQRQRAAAFLVAVLAECRHASRGIDVAAELQCILGSVVFDDEPAYADASRHGDVRHTRQAAAHHAVLERLSPPCIGVDGGQGHVILIPYPLLRGIAPARKVLSQCLKVQPSRLSVRPLRAVPYQADARLRRRAESRAVDGCERLRQRQRAAAFLVAVLAECRHASRGIDVAAELQCILGSVVFDDEPAYADASRHGDVRHTRQAAAHHAVLERLSPPCIGIKVGYSHKVLPYPGLRGITQPVNPSLCGIAAVRQVLSQRLEIQSSRLSVRPLRAVPHQADTRLRRRTESCAVDRRKRLRQHQRAAAFLFLIVRDSHTEC